MQNVLERQQTATPAPASEGLINDAPRLIEDFPVGTVFHQGDLIGVSIGSLPKSAKPRANRQLADGDTQGSRHILTRGEVFDCDANEVAALIKKANGCQVEARYIGPVYRSPDNPTENDLQHPEHGDIGVGAGCIVAIVTQRNLDALEREQRVRD